MDTKAGVYQTCGLNGESPENRAGVARDLEMAKLCAAAMGITSSREVPYPDRVELVCYVGGPGQWERIVYDPLHDDAQAMALVKRFRLHPIPDNDREGYWDVFVGKPYSPTVYGSDPDLNRAIVECASKLQASRTTTSEPVSS